MTAPHQPTPEQRAQVTALAEFGTREDEIAKYIGIDPKTLRKHYRRELDIAHIEANQKVANALFKAAVEDGSVPAAIFWMKARGSWSEKLRVEGSGEPVQIIINKPDGA